MDLYPTSSEYAHWPVVANTNLTDATAEAYVEGSWRALIWTGAAVQDGDEWTRTARLLVRGASGAAGVIVTASVNNPPFRVTASGEVIVRKSRENLTLRS